MFVLHPVISLQPFMLFHVRYTLPSIICEIPFSLQCVVYSTSSRVRLLAFIFQLHLPGCVTLGELLNFLYLMWTKWLEYLHIVYYFHLQVGGGSA